VRDQRLWTWHIGAGAVILVLLGLHMTVMHLDAVVRVFSPQPGEPIGWANVMERGKSVFFLVTYVLLLGAALFHGFYGLRNIVFELNPGAGVRKTVTLLLVGAGAALFIVGTWAAFRAYGLANAGVLAGN
jgi:succinate dehydrogenase / fumarate reductase membrane anchor subunit